MADKQGPEKTELIKDEAAGHNQYILQKNTKTKTAIYIVIAFLIFLMLGVAVSALYFGN